MRANEQRPTISHAVMIWIVFSEMTRVIIDAVKRLRNAKKWVKRASPFTYSVE